MRVWRVLMVTVLTMGCSGSKSDDSPQKGADFAGTWRGNTSVAMMGQEAYSYASKMVVTVEGDVVTINAVCPGGDGQIEAAVVDGVATWQGSLECAPVNANSCNAVTVTYVSGKASIKNGTLTASVEGTAVGCDQVIAMTADFVGAKM